MKKNKIALLLGTFAFVFIAFITSVNALSVDSNTKLLDLNLKQAEIATEIEKTVKEEAYPPYFGGVYVSEDSTHVIIQIVEDKLPTTKNTKEYSTFNKIANIDSNVKIEYVKYSYKELNDINDKLIEYFSSEKADLSNLSAHYVDTFNNVVVVELKENNLKRIENFEKTVLGVDEAKKSIINSDIITFTEGEQHTDELKAGEKISVTGGSCSMGYRVKIGGKAGYITAGHCFNGVGDSATGGTVKNYKYSGKVDAAFVQTNIITFPSNSLKYTSGSITTLNNNLCPILSLNMAIAKSGYSTGYTSGQIKNLNYSATYNGTYFTGLIAANYSSAGGDSGGAVFVPNNVNGGAPLAGIHKGTSSYGTAFVDENQIYLAFGYSRY